MKKLESLKTQMYSLDLSKGNSIFGGGNSKPNATTQEWSEKSQCYFYYEDSPKGKGKRIGVLAPGKEQECS